MTTPIETDLSKRTAVVTGASTGIGKELIWATNVLSPHLLTEKLLPALRKARKARIVNVASTAITKLDVDDVQMERRGFDGFKAYGQSKLANRMLTWALAERLAGSG